MKSVLAVVSVAGVLIGGTVACADTVLTFEGHQNTIYTAPIVRSGYQIRNPVGQQQHFHEVNSTTFGLPNNGTGILLNDRQTEIQITMVGGGDFSLVSFDAAVYTSVGTMTVTGYSNGGVVGSFNTGSLSTTTFANFGGLSLGSIDEVRFSSDNPGGSNGFTLDNVTLREGVIIPLPGAAGMGLAGLGLVAVRRRRA